MLSADRRDFVPPSDCNSVNEVFMMHRLDLYQENKRLGYFSDSCFNPYNVLLLDMPVLVTFLLLRRGIQLH